MKEHPFHAFIDLINFDQSMQEIQTTIETLKRQMASDQEILTQMHHDLDSMKKHVHNMRKQVDMQELEMKALDDQEKEAKYRLDESSNQKEYYAIKSEIQQLKKKQAIGEGSLIAAWDQLTSGEKEYEEKHKSYESHTQQLQEHIHKLQKMNVEKQQEYALRIAGRDEKRKDVPEEWLHKYEIMKARIADPVVQLLHGACGTCSYAIPDHDLMRLKRGALIQCKNCFRLIYSPEVMDQPSA
jgi:predicted  nucleic acid-binding Zn-ribbon protein